MMKHGRLVFVISLATLAILFSSRVSAETDQSLFPASLVQACPSVKTRLKQVYLNDDLTRVNYGQTYESLLKNVITPTNARLVANRFDASELVSLAAEIEAKLELFRLEYQNYKTARIELIALDCQTKPADFYQQLQAVRSNRAKLKTLSDEMAQMAAIYRSKFEELTK